MLQNNAVTQTKDILIKIIRAFLSNKENYSSIVEVDFSDSDIFDKQPLKLIKYPSILISAISGTYINSGIGDISHELYDEYGNFRGYRYSGMIELPITIELATRTSKSRDQITDLLSFALRVLLRRQLESYGILIKDMRYGGESEITYDSDKIYISTLQLTTWSEWSNDVDLLPLTGIDINIDYKENK